MSNGDLIARLEEWATHADEMAKDAYEFDAVNFHEEARRYRESAAALAAQEEEIGRLLGTRRWNVEETAGGLRVCVGDHHRSTDCEWIEYVPASEIARLTSALQERDAVCERAREALEPFMAFSSVLHTQGTRGTWFATALNGRWSEKLQEWVTGEEITVHEWQGRGEKRPLPDYFTVAVVAWETAGGNCPAEVTVGDLRRASTIHAELSTISPCRPKSAGVATGAVGALPDDTGAEGTPAENAGPGSSPGTGSTAALSPQPQTGGEEGMSDPVKLKDCPIGLFRDVASGELCLKTEYGNNEGRIDAYIVSSGEFYWGAAPQTIASQREQMVIPFDLDEALALSRLGLEAAFPSEETIERLARAAQSSGDNAVRNGFVAQSLMVYTFAVNAALSALVQGEKTR